MVNNTFGFGGRESRQSKIGQIRPASVANRSAGGYGRLNLEDDEFFRKDDDLLHKDKRRKERSDLDDDEDSLFVRDTRVNQVPFASYNMGQASSTAIDSDFTAQRVKNVRKRGRQHDNDEFPAALYQAPGSSRSGKAETSPAKANNNQPLTTGSAHEMKSALANVNLAPTTTHKRRLPVEHDPENHIIKRMRVEERKSWGDIAKHLNLERIKEGKTPTFTEAAVYGRFVRNGPRVAALQGDTTFNPKDYMHLKGVNESADNGNAALLQVKERFTPTDDELLVETYLEVQRAMWENVSRILEQKTKKKFSPEACAVRYNAL